MDPDVFPNSVEYWGPNGMVFFRNVQIRWTPWQKGDSNFMIALERPGASADQGEYAGRIELQNVKARFPLPDLSAHFRYAKGWGHVQVAGIVRQMKWDDLNDDQYDLSGDATGWGINVSSNLKLAKHVARLQVAYGAGVQNYWNDAPVDVGIQNNFSNPRTPVVGKALPILGIVAFLDLNWNDEVDEHGRLLSRGHRQQRRPDERRLQEGPVRARERALPPDSGRVPGSGNPVGQARELPGRLHVGRRPDPVLGQVQLQAVAGRQVMIGEKTVRDGRRLLVAGLVVLGLVAAPAAWAQAPAEIQGALDAAYAKYKDLQEGKNADYIPALAKVDPKIYGIALVTADGKVYTAGDVKSEVSIQSISKVFTMAKVIEESGAEAIEKRIGVDATGMRFNSIVAVEFAQKALGGPEINPLVNPGAITATSMVKGASRDEVWKSILGFYSDFAGRPLGVNQEVFKSESDTNQRNQAIGYLMYAYEFIKSNPMQATDVYTEQCSVNVNAKDLATMAGTLANGGKNPVTGKQVMSTANVPKVLAVMATAGLYDDSGKWLYHTGLPGKSGVGGGIIAVSPGKFGIAVVSPPLDDAGNSVRAQKAIADVSNALGGNPLASKPR